LKLVYNPENADLLGLQIMGPGQAVKRVDVFGNLLLSGGKVDDLLDLEFAYSPPYSPALDPLFTIGSAAQNEMDGVLAVAPGYETGDSILLDLRTEQEAMNKPLEGSLNIALEDIRARCDELPRDKKIVAICAKGARSAEGARILLQNGFSDVVFIGGGIFMRR